MLKIAEPSLGVLLMDATRKKTDYLERTATELELDVEVRQARAEDAGHDLALRESFDIVTCRAIGRWPVVLELALPFCKTGGVVLAQRGAESPREAEAYASGYGHPRRARRERRTGWHERRPRRAARDHRSEGRAYACTLSEKSGHTGEASAELML